MQFGLYSAAIFPKSLVYCNATFDSYLCWPPTAAGEIVEQNCPPARLSDTTRLANRRCGDNGLWVGRRKNESSAIGWTNYTPCFPSIAQKLLVKLYEDEKDTKLIFQIAQRTRTMEIVGFSISLIALIVSLIIFSNYRSLRNHRTRIHKSLFFAMIVQVIIRLTIYIDQAIIRSQLDEHFPTENVTFQGIDNMPYLCESSYILLEYTNTVMFMWMFIEGLYLHNVVTASTLCKYISYPLFYSIGWGFPIVLTAIWAIVTAYYYEMEDHIQTCWYGYNFISHYWILEGPRICVISINFLFLLNIMRVLIGKLQHSENTEVTKVRKAVKAAIVLLPLLGITNATTMIEPPLTESVWKFALWSYSTHFLRSFQGFFIAFIYCFLNGEVRTVLKKHYNDYIAMRQTNTKNKNSILVVGRDVKTMTSVTNVINRFGSLSDTGIRNKQRRNVRKCSWCPFKKLCLRNDDTTFNFDTEVGPETVQSNKRESEKNESKPTDILETYLNEEIENEQEPGKSQDGCSTIQVIVTIH